MVTVEESGQRGLVALVTGISGQDGSYLAESLLRKGYEVHGVVRRSSTPPDERLKHLRHEGGGGPILHLHDGDLGDLVSLMAIVERVQPSEVYNLASQSDVRLSFDMPEYTFDVTGLGAFRVLEAVRRGCPSARVFQAGSSEMFGRVAGEPQDERTPFHPRSPYGIAKVFAHHTAVHYREAYGLFVANGIMFNHESPRRGENFVTRKVAAAAARIAAGSREELRLGNLEARRDWGYAPEFVEGMWAALQCSAPGDYVLATGVTHSVEELVATAFGSLGLRWQDHVAYEPALRRPTEVDVLRGDAGKAAEELNWRARTTFEELVEIMVSAEMAAGPGALDLRP